MKLHACLQFDDESFGILRNIPGGLAVDIYQRYRDEDCARREGIANCWVTSVIDFQLILGHSPAGWSSDSPMRENRSQHVGRISAA
jgi:hypothetical protein